MKKKNNSPCVIFVLLTVFFLVLAGSCKKNEFSKTEILTTGKWKITEHTERCYCGTNGFGLETLDLYSLYQECKKDNNYLFNRNNSGEVNEGYAKCNSTDSQTVSFFWTFINNEISISLNGTVWKILQLNNSKFVITTILTLSGKGETMHFTKI